MLESFERTKLKSKDAMIDKLNMEINGLKKDKAKLEDKVRKLLEFIGGSDPTTNASKRRSFTERTNPIADYTDPKEREAIVVRKSNETPHPELQDRSVR